MLSSLYAKLNNIKNHQGFLRYFKNTSWLFAEKIIKIFSGLFVTIWVARYLGPEQFGILNYVISFAFFFTTFATLGLDSIIVKEIVQKNQTNVLMGSAFILKIISAIITLSAVTIITQLTSNEASVQFLIVIATSVVIFQSFNVIGFFNQANVISKHTVIASSISLILSMFTKMTLIFFAAPLEAFIYVLLFEAFCLAVGLIYFYQLHNKITQWSFDLQISKKLLKDSWPLMFAGILITIYMRIDQIMIAQMLGYEANGQYAAAVVLSESWYFIPVLITSSVFPAIINSKRQSDIIYHERLQKLYNLMVGIALLTIILVILSGEFVIHWLYGEEYASANEVLLIHIWAGLFVALGVARSKWIVAESLQIYTLYYAGVGMLTNIVLNYFLIPSMGIKGAAVATLIAQITVALFLPCYFRKTRLSFFMFMRAILMIDFYRWIFTNFYGAYKK